MSVWSRASTWVASAHKQDKPPPGESRQQSRALHRRRQLVVMPLFFASSALYPIAIMLHLGGRLVVARLVVVASFLTITATS